jgi:hypothetical protein
MVIGIIFLSANIAIADMGKPFTPESMIPSGVDEASATNPYDGEQGVIRKGTIEATIVNIALLNRLLNDSHQTADSQIQIDMAVDEIKHLIPSLKILGMFDVFVVDEWTNFKPSRQWGRMVCILLYLQQYPDNITMDIKEKLHNLRKLAPSKVITDLIDDISVK